MLGLKLNHDSKMGPWIPKNIRLGNSNETTGPFDHAAQGGNNFQTMTF